MASVKCQVCTKMVFAMEKLSAEGKHFHKSCFKVRIADDRALV